MNERNVIGRGSCDPAEFLIDLVSVDTSSEEAETKSRARIDALAAACTEAATAAAFMNGGGDDDDDDVQKKKSADANGKAAVVGGSGNGGGGGGGGGGFVKQFGLLLQRSWRQVRRDDATNSVRLATSLNSAFVFGSIFWRMGKSQTSIQGRSPSLHTTTAFTRLNSRLF